MFFDSIELEGRPFLIELRKVLTCCMAFKCRKYVRICSGGDD